MAAMEPDAWGRFVFDEDDVVELILSRIECDDLLVADTEEFRRFNERAVIKDKANLCYRMTSEPELSPEEEHAERSGQWLIDPGDDVDTLGYLLALCKTDLERDRVRLEMMMFRERAMEPVIRLMIALVDHFRREGIVWGVGRGSSVASYVLYLIGVHKIDSLRFNLDIGEFLR